MGHRSYSSNQSYYRDLKSLDRSTSDNQLKGQASRKSSSERWNLNEVLKMGRISKEVIERRQKDKEEKRSCITPKIHQREPKSKGTKIFKMMKRTIKKKQMIQIILNCCRDDLGRHLHEFPELSNISQRGLCKASEICSFKALATRNPKSRYWSNYAPCEAWWQFLHLLISDWKCLESLGLLLHKTSSFKVSIVILDNRTTVT